MRRVNQRLGTLVLSLGLAAPVSAATITIKGSDSLVILARKWAELYTSKHSATKIHVSGGGTGVGFGGPASGRGARPLKLKAGSGGAALTPTEESVSQGRYPIRRYLYLYVNPALDRGEIAAFLNWIRSDEGQGVAREMGCYALPAHLRERGPTDVVAP